MRVAAAIRKRVLGAFTAALLAVPSGVSASDLDGFTGAWVRTERERDDAAREAEIVRVTERMSFAIRGFARGMMRRRIRPEERYEIAKNSEGAWIRDDEGDVIRIDGRTHATGTGEESTCRLTDEREIEESWKHGAESHGVTVWRLADGGGRLVVSETIYNSNFEGPIEFSTTYERAGPE
jgi:hypothetical protein